MFSFPFFLSLASFLSFSLLVDSFYSFFLYYILYVFLILCFLVNLVFRFFAFSFSVSPSCFLFFDSGEPKIAQIIHMMTLREPFGANFGLRPLPPYRILTKGRGRSAPFPWTSFFVSVAFKKGPVYLKSVLLACKISGASTTSCARA